MIKEVILRRRHQQKDLEAEPAVAVNVAREPEVQGESIVGENVPHINGAGIATSMNTSKKPPPTFG